MMQMLRFREEKYVASANVTVLRFTQSRKAEVGVTEMKRALTSNGIYCVFENSKPIGVVDSLLGVSSTNSFLDPLPVKCFQHGEYEDESINYSQSMKLG